VGYATNRIGNEVLGYRLHTHGSLTRRTHSIRAKMAGFEALLLPNKDINELTKELSGGILEGDGGTEGNSWKKCVNLTSLRS
jgi:hypothetical protein